MGGNALTEEEQFLAAVEAEPDDVVRRGALADYLDEHGKPELAAWHRSGAVMGADEFRKSVIAQDDDNDYDESGWVACVVTRHGVEVALLARYGHCSCYGTFTSLVGGGVNDSGRVNLPTWDWIGSPTDLAGMARRNADPTMPARTVGDGDYDADHLRAVYAQVLVWWANLACANPIANPPLTARQTPVFSGPSAGDNPSS